MRGKQPLPHRQAGSNGVVFYEGPSVLDGNPIVAIATGIIIPSMNRKTGFMIQTWIMNADLPPLDAVRSGEDKSICGNCPLRGDHGKRRACYVTLHDVPTRVWHAWKDRRYPKPEDARWAKDRYIRFGSYGDPTAVPFAIWNDLAKRAAGWTGYTHEWRRTEFQVFRRLLMASIEKPEDAWTAWSFGWRTYRIRLPNDELMPFESVCPASNEAGWKSSCLICGQCDGSRPFDVRRSYAIVAHGSRVSAYAKSRLPVIA